MFPLGLIIGVGAVAATVSSIGLTSIVGLVYVTAGSFFGGTSLIHLAIASAFLPWIVLGVLAVTITAIFSIIWLVDKLHKRKEKK